MVDKANLVGKGGLFKMKDGAPDPTALDMSLYVGVSYPTTYMDEYPSDAVGLRNWNQVSALVYAPGFAPGDPPQVSVTRQEFAEEADINVIMRRYETAGQWPPPPNSSEPLYVDFTSVPSTLMDTMAQMDQATDAFMSLPARVRREFDNDPHAFVAYASDPGNVGQMRDWGLAAPLAVPPPAAPAASGAVSAPSGSPAPSSSSGAPAPTTAS